MITAYDILALVTFLRTHASYLITGGFTLFATGAIVWDNHKGCDHAVSHLDSKIDGFKNELKADISCVEHKVDLIRNNVVVFGQTILKAQDGDKQQLRDVLLKIEEACKESGGC